MAIEVLLLLILLIAIALSILIVHLHWRRYKPLLPKAFLLASFVIFSVIKFYEANAIALTFAWFSIVMATSLALDALTAVNGEVNEKLAIALMLTAISGVGVPINTVILLSPVDTWIKAFSLSILIAIHVPILVAMIIYLVGRRRTSKELIKKFCLNKQ